MNYENNILKLPELLRHDNKQHDPERVTAYHEAAHGLVMVSHGLLPRYTSLIPVTGVLGFSTVVFELGYDLGINWGPEFLLMHSFGGICGGAAYSGIYDWQGSARDMKEAAAEAEHYKMEFSEVLRIWIATNEFVQQNYDLLEKAAEQLYQDKILGPEYWEENILFV